ncbi:hypothetical protein S83_060608 [Arachis hypogaea]
MQASRWRQRGALLVLRQTSTGEKPFSLLFFSFSLFFFLASSYLRIGDVKTVATSVPLASFDASRRPPQLVYCFGNTMTTPQLQPHHPCLLVLFFNFQGDADVICSGAWKFWPLELMACVNFDRE